MSELDLNLGGEPFRMKPENTTLFMFIGDLAVYNHVFFVTKNLEDGRVAGTYLFRDNPSFDQLRTFMEENSYPMHINLREVAEVDQTAWNGYYLKDLESGLPEEWSEHGSK